VPGGARRDAGGDNPPMRIRFTKMQGAGNDFVVLDETRGPLGLTAAQYRFLGDRHFGVGADQILTVRPSPAEGIDFQYVIHNADGGEVEQCGNGARCFMRYVREHGLTDKDQVQVQTLAGVIAPRMGTDGRVTVDMGGPIFEPGRVPFDTAGLTPVTDEGSWSKWHLALGTRAESAIVSVAILSMGNPHAVQVVDDTEAAPVAEQGPLIEHHPRFPQRVNAGFMQVVDRSHIKLRVYERGAGETLACGTGACAAVVAGIRLGLLDSRVDVQTHGGVLTIEWAGGGAPVSMTGPATTVFEGEIDVPDVPDARDLP
jgi:diaminopimelate epimerase